MCCEVTNFLFTHLSSWHANQSMFLFSVVVFFFSSFLWWWRTVVHFRYSGSESGGQQPIPLSMEGLCSHHGQILAAHLAGGASLGRQGSLGSAQIQSRGYTTSFPGKYLQKSSLLFTNALDLND